MKGFGFVAIVVVTVFLFGVGTPFVLVRLGSVVPASTPRPTLAPDPTSVPTVTLQAAPGQNVVQMFDSVSGDSAVTRFATGLRCYQLDGPIHVTESGVSMSFYKLNCMNTIGYVNTKWVR